MSATFDVDSFCALAAAIVADIVEKLRQLTRHQRYDAQVIKHVLERCEELSATVSLHERRLQKLEDQMSRVIAFAVDVADAEYANTPPAKPRPLVED